MKSGWWRRGPAGVLLAAVIAVAAGCGGASTSTGGSTSSTTSGQSQALGPQNTIVDATDVSSEVTMDPGSAYESYDIVMGMLAYSRLVTFPYGSMQKVQPMLAKSYSVSPDGKTWTFNLKQGIKFASGNEVTAQDVVYTFQRVVNLPKDPASWLITQTGITSKNVTQAVKATGKYTVTITLPQAFSQGAFLAILANNISDIVDAKTVQAHVKNGDFGAAWLYNHSAGSGPYELLNWTKGVKIEVVSNPNYNLGPKPTIKHIIWQNVSDTTSRLDELKRGNADIAEGLTNAQVASMAGNTSFKVFKTPEEAMTYVGMDVGNVPCFKKSTCLQAVKYAIDYKGIIQHLLSGNGVALQGIIPHGIFGYDSQTPFSYDPAKAKQLLAQAGYPNGFSATLTIPSGTTSGGGDAASLGDALKSSMAAAGINISLRQIEASELYSEYRAHKLQMVLGTWGMDYPDPQDFAAPFGDYTQKSLIWRLQDNDKTLAKLVEQASGMQNTPQRAALYKQIDQLEYTTGPFALIYQPDNVIVYSTKVKNFTYDDANGIAYPLLSKSQ